MENVHSKLPCEARASRVLLYLLFTCFNSVMVAFETPWPGKEQSVLIRLASKAEGLTNAGLS
jgi:hypothetical protein